LLWNHTNLQEKIGMQIFEQKDEKSQERIYDRKHVEHGKKMLLGAHSRFKFIQKLLQDRLQKPGTEQEEGTPTERARIEGLDALTHAHDIARMSIDSSILEHLHYCEVSLEKANAWYEQLTSLEEDQEMRNQEAARRKQEEEDRAREIKEQNAHDELRKRRARNERAELLTQEISNTALPDVSEKPKELPVRGQKRRADEFDAERPVFPRNDGGPPEEPLEPGEDEEELMDELFGPGEEDDPFDTFDETFGEVDETIGEAAGGAAGETADETAERPQTDAELLGELFGEE
jgi:hypothetical protein